MKRKLRRLLRKSFWHFRCALSVFIISFYQSKANRYVLLCLSPISRDGLERAHMNAHMNARTNRRSLTRSHAIRLQFSATDFP